MSNRRTRERWRWTALYLCAALPAAVLGAGCQSEDHGLVAEPDGAGLRFSDGTAAPLADGRASRDAGLDGSVGDSSSPPAEAGVADSSRDSSPGPDTRTLADPCAGHTAPCHALVVDRAFQRGVTLQDPTTGALQEDLQPDPTQGTPVWWLAQWGSNSTLSGTAPQQLASGSWRWATADKAVSLGPLASADADLILQVDAWNEYGGVYDAAGSGRLWPHLLVQQRLSPPDQAGPGCPALSRLQSVPFSIAARLVESQRNQQPGWDPARHVAHFMVYFVIQNLMSGPGSPGYGDYLWLGLTFYDDREAIPDLEVLHDGGTSKLIYNIGLAPYHQSSLSDGAWHQLSLDLLPQIKLALQEAWSLGYLPDSDYLSDYAIGEMNLGWEVTGLNTVAMQTRDLALAALEQEMVAQRFEFNVDGDSQGWTAHNLTPDANGPSGGQWSFTCDAQDPQLVSPPMAVDAASFSTLSVRMAQDGNPPGASTLQVFWKRFGEPQFSESKSVSTAVASDGSWQTYTFDLSAHSLWRGQITGLRVDPIWQGDGHPVAVDYIRLAP